MKVKVVLSLTGLLLLLPLSTIAGPMALLKNEKIELTSPIRKGENVRGVYFIGNPGDSTLTIMDVDPG